MSLRKIQKLNQKTHRDRPQPLSRESFGYLEHKKDWLQRSRDVQSRKKKLKKLRAQALLKNPDEYRHHMVNSELGLDGIHRELDPDSDDEMLLQKKFEGIRDLHYVEHKLSVERKKIEKLKGQFENYEELQFRIERERELTIVWEKLKLKKDLEASKGSQLKPKLLEKGSATKAAQYKWTYERKK